MTEMRWRTMSEETRDREYNPSSCLVDGNYAPFVRAYRDQSDTAWAQVSADNDATVSLVRYGDRPSQTIDVAVPTDATSAAPLLVFIHGGYWQELSKLDARFPARASTSNGWGFAAVDYTLAPDASVTGIVAECCAAVRMLQRESTQLGVDAARIIVAGSSAGAHLAAMVAAKAAIAGAVLVSGVFELEPLIGLSINDALRLDVGEARANSPLALDVSGFPTTLLAYGDNETSEFKAQTAAFARHLEAASVAARTIEIAGRNHFDVILDLAELGTELGDAVADLVESTRPGS